MTSERMFLLVEYFLFSEIQKMCYLLKKSHFCIIRYHVLRLFRQRYFQTVSTFHRKFSGSSPDFNECKNIGSILKDLVGEGTMSYSGITKAQ